MNDQRRVPDVERAVVDLLTGLTPDPTTVGVDLPTDWKSRSTAHLQVGWDGTAVPTHRITARALVRINAWASTKSEAKALALDAEARLCAHDGSGVISTIRTATGVQPTRDPDTGAELAWFTVHVTARTQPLP